jgi:hypothetical protein
MIPALNAKLMVIQTILYRINIVGCAAKLTVNTFFRLRDKYYCKKHASGELQQVVQEVLNQPEIGGYLLKYYHFSLFSVI